MCFFSHAGPTVLIPPDKLTTDNNIFNNLLKFQLFQLLF